MNIYVNLFNNREKAIIVWVLAFFSWALFQNNIRASFYGVIKAFTHYKILIVLTAMLLYISLIVLLFYKLQLWDPSLTKDTIYWVIGVAFVLLMNANKATQEKDYFKNLLLDNLKVIVALEFIINLYTFNFWVELFLVPLLVLIVAVGAVAELKKEDFPAKKMSDSVLSFFGIFLILFTLIRLLSDFQGFANVDNLRSFLLPVLLTLAFMPFLYLFALLMAYELLFVRLGIFLKENKALANFAQKRIFMLCLLDLGKVNRFAKESTMDLLSLKDKDDVMRMIQRH
jgi:hypothetical protein